MNRTTVSLTSGLFIGLANLAWLYLAYFLGMHTSGVAAFGAFILIWLALNIVAFVLALKRIERHSGPLGYWAGLRAGAVASLASGVVASIAQVGYFNAIHPEWPEYVAEQTRRQSVSQGLPSGEIEALVERARQTVTLTNYAIQSAVTAMALGVVLSSINMFFLRSSRRADAVARRARTL